MRCGAPRSCSQDAGEKRSAGQGGAVAGVAEKQREGRLIFGEVAALLSSICFSVGPTFNTIAGRYVGAVTVNRARLFLTTLMLIPLHWLIVGTPYPAGTTGERWLWLGISAVSSLVLADTLLFRAFGYIGTRLTMLIHVLSPVFSAVLAWIFLEEILGVWEIVGIALTIIGVAWVIVNDENNAGEQEDSSDYLKGIFLALGAAILHAVGATAVKPGLTGDFPVLSGHIIRMSLAMAVYLLWSALGRQIRPSIQRFEAAPRALRHVAIAAIVGPLAGMWLSLTALKLTSVGIASTLMSLPPVFLIPIGYFVFDEAISISDILGTVIALAGVAIIFLA